MGIRPIVQLCLKQCSSECTVDMAEIIMAWYTVYGYSYGYEKHKQVLLTKIRPAKLFVFYIRDQLDTNRRKNWCPAWICKQLGVPYTSSTKMACGAQTNHRLDPKSFVFHIWEQLDTNSRKHWSPAWIWKKLGVPPTHQNGYWSPNQTKKP